MFSITTFHELLKGLPRERFDRFVRLHNADKHCKGFTHWDHLVAMLYCQLTEAPSLRTLETGFNSLPNHHYHLDADNLKRSTLSWANANRRDTVFRDVVQWLMGQVKRKLRKETTELKYLLDSTSLTLKGPGFDEWTNGNRTRNTQGIKVHVLLDTGTQSPSWCEFSAANVNDVTKAWDVPLREGALYVFDKGYCDYAWWASIDNSGSQFVTRFKSNAGIHVQETLPVPDEATGVVLSDQVVVLKHKRPGGKPNQYTKPLRRITIARADKPTPLVLATNDMNSTALEIAQHYKDRWGIELFFKWIKQHLKIKKFIGRSENAVRIQVLTALISYLLIALYKQRNALKRSLWDCLVLVRATLFHRIKTELDNYARRRRQHEAERQCQGRLFA